jgi:RND family efflux transporter MFP subunit
MMKVWIKWTVAVAVVAALGFGVLRALNARKAQQAAVAAATAPKAQTQVDLASTDLLTVRSLTLAQGVPLSGTVKASNWAVLKARVAGELQGLTVREGDMVKAGQVLARIESVEYEARVNQAQRQAEAAKAQIDIAKRQYDNNQALVDQGFISKTALDTSWATLESAQASYKAALAAVDVSRKSLDDTVLRSPISGTVSQRLTQPGERVGIDAKVLEIMDLSRLEVEATVSASDTLAVRVGQQASLQIEGQPYSGKVVRINPSAQPGSRSVLLYLGIDRAAGLRQGLFAEGKLGTGSANALALPLSAVRTDKPLPYVQRVENNQIVHTPVVLGMRGETQGAADLYVGLQGLAAGDTVVAGNIGVLREGTHIKRAANN